MNHNTTPPSNMKRSKKPMPLFGLFRKNKPDPIVPHQQQQQSPLGSGISSVPFNSMLSPTYYHQQQADPYSPPRIPKPSVSDSRKPTRQQPPQPPQQQPQQPQQQRQRTRQRSKSVGRDPSTMVLEGRELALNKLCKREPSSSLADSLPLLSPTYKTTAPPVPPIPLKHQPSSHSMRKFSSAHDLRKAAKLQQESMNQQVPLPIKHEQLSRSRSLSASPRKLHTSKSHQNLVKSPTTPTWTRSYKKSFKPPAALDSGDDDDDNVPLGYLQSPTSKPSSLLSDQEEDDDKDLVPIAVLDIKPTEEFQTAADKYKLKVKERLQFDDHSSGQEEEEDDDDDIPISLALMSPKWKKKEIKRF
ncbi:sterol carrier protein 2 [Mucor velutinosus]|uniref:Sterol carrier protein 2 n=1 Tax=Mucor velutinosus TaxID=708070 RepID=A0AAN7D963_9FUNG|nr:sterol carrier protein 2 [Mucor velutinosus]